jgi:hypothetical protein
MPEWTPSDIDPVSLIVGAFIIPTLIAITILVRRFIVTYARYLVEGILYHISFKLKRTLAYRLTLKHYARKQLNGPTRHVHVPASEEISVEIDRIFVPLVMEARSQGSAFDHTTVERAGNRVVIIGDPGSGKSCLSKRIFRDECHDVRYGFARHFPILVPLRDVPFKSAPPTESGKWLLDWVVQSLGIGSLYDAEGAVDSFTRTTGVLLVLDGLDEVASDDYEAARHAINDLSALLASLSGSNIVFLTMRTQFHVQIRQDFREQFPVVLTIRSFTPADIYGFLTKWNYKTKPVENINRIFSALSDRPTLREMCSNPLILSMYVASDQEGRSLVPDSRTEFYTRVVEELVVRRRAFQTGQRDGVQTIRKQRLRILGRVALDHLLDASSAANSIKWESGIAAVRRITQLSSTASEAFLREMSKETGIVTEEREREVFRFIHLTFCEFLAAYEALQGSRDGWQRLITAHVEAVRSSNPSLRARLAEVIPFACGLMPQHMQAEALELVKQAGTRTALLALLETKDYSSSAGSDLVTTSRDTLVGKAAKGFDVDDYSLFHLYIVVCLDAQRYHEITSPGRETGNLVDDLFRRLNAQSATLVEELIAQYAKQDAVTALRIAALYGIDARTALFDMVVDNCGQPAFLALLIERAGRFRADRAVWSCALAEAALRSSNVAALIEKAGGNTWAEDAESMGREKRWFAPGLVERSAFTECVTFALSELGSVRAKVPLLRALNEIKPAGSRKMDAFLAPLSVALRFGSVPLFMLLAWIVYGLFADQIHLAMESASAMALLTVMAAASVGLLISMYLYLDKVSERKRLLNELIGDPFTGRFMASVLRGPQTVITPFWPMSRAHYRPVRVPKIEYPTFLDADDKEAFSAYYERALVELKAETGVRRFSAFPVDERPSLERLYSLKLMPSLEASLRLSRRHWLLQRQLDRDPSRAAKHGSAVGPEGLAVDDGEGQPKAPQSSPRSVSSLPLK